MEQPVSWFQDWTSPTSLRERKEICQSSFKLEDFKVCHWYQKGQFGTQLLSSSGFWGKAFVSAVLFCTIPDSAVAKNCMCWPFLLACPSSTSGEIANYMDKQQLRDQPFVILISFSAWTQKGWHHTLLLYQMTWVETGSLVKGIAGGKWGGKGQKSVRIQYLFVLLLTEQRVCTRQHLQQTSGPGSAL